MCTQLSSLQKSCASVDHGHRGSFLEPIPSHPGNQREGCTEKTHRGRECAPLGIETPGEPSQRGRLLQIVPKQLKHGAWPRTAQTTSVVITGLLTYTCSQGLTACHPPPGPSLTLQRSASLHHGNGGEKRDPGPKHRTTSRGEIPCLGTPTTKSSTWQSLRCPWGSEPLADGLHVSDRGQGLRGLPLVRVSATQITNLPKAPTAGFWSGGIRDHSC